MSPEVYDDALPRILAVTASLGLHVQNPNEDPGNRPSGINSQPVPWLDFEVAGESARAIEIGGTIWDEQGSIFLHLWIPIGTGVRDGLVTLQALRNAFRGVSDATDGLVYRNDHSFQMFNDDDGVYRKLTAIIHYHFQDRTV